MKQPKNYGSWTCSFSHFRALNHKSLQIESPEQRQQHQVNAFIETRMIMTTFYDVGGCQNYGPLLGTLNIRCRIIIVIQKGTIILTTTHVGSAEAGRRAVMSGNETSGKHLEIVRMIEQSKSVGNLGSKLMA